MMERCNECRDLLWEDLYGLLEPGEQDRLRSHLSTCPACRQAQSQVLAQQRLLAHTARLDVDIPLFKPPTNSKPLRPVVLRASFLNGRWARYALAAAAALLLVLLPLGIYQQGRHVRELALQEAEERLAAVVAKQEESRSQILENARELIRQVHAKHTELHVEGPGHYRPERFNQYRAWANDSTPIRALVEDTRTHQVLFEKQLKADNGQIVLALPPDLPLSRERSARIQFSAMGGRSRDAVQAPLRLEDPVDVTRLVTDKTTYHPGETIYFDSLTVDRQTFKPPAGTVTLSYSLSGPNQRMVGKAQRKSASDGTGAGHVALPADCIEGEYVLTVESSDDQFLPAKRLLFVGKAPRPGAKANDPLRIDLVPEGGTFIAGIPCRVFFTARTTAGQPVDVAGQIQRMRGMEVLGVVLADVQSQVTGLGEFTVTPVLGESYRFAATIAGRNVWISLPPVEKNGLALAVSSGVLKAGEPLRLRLHNQGAARQVAVRVEHLGKLVAEKRLPLNSGSNTIELPPQGFGAMHVAVYEVQADQLLPLADRLVYQEPARRLAIGVQSDKHVYIPGETVTLRLDSKSEQGKPDPAWLAVAAVDRSVAGNLLQPATLDLAAEIQPEEVDSVFAGAGPGADAVKALDLFLGAQAWLQPAGRLPDDDRLVLDNSEELRRTWAKELKPQLARMDADFAAGSRELETQGDERLAALGMARQTLNDYENHASRFAFSGFWACTGLALVLGLARFGLAAKAGPRLTSGFALATSVAALVLVASLLLTESAPRPTSGLVKAFQASSAEQSALIARLTNPERDTPKTGPSATSILAPVFDRGKSVKTEANESLPVELERPFAYHRPATGLEKGPAPETIYWNPTLFAANGTAEVKFDLPMRPATYVVHIEAHDAEGRLAAVETTVECRAAAK